MLLDAVVERNVAFASLRCLAADRTDMPVIEQGAASDFCRVLRLSLGALPAVA
jgi:hypothetical protein